MPTKAQIESAMEQLEKLVLLPTSERDTALAEMDWSGFTESQKLDVERRVAENEPEDFWMDGVEEDGPTQNYQVWHITDDKQALLTMIGMIDPPFPAAYTHVATVETDSMDRAFSLTNHGDAPWQENDGVNGIEARSTSVGDVIIDPYGRPHRVENHEFRELPSLLESPLGRVERDIRQLKKETEILLESTRHYVMPDPEDVDSVYDTCDSLGPWGTLTASEKLTAMNDLDWRGIDPGTKQRIIDREINHPDPGLPDPLARDDSTLAEGSRIEGHECQVSGGETGRQVRPLTNDLITAVLLDIWPKVPTIVDFGIDSESHLGALQYAIKHGEVTPQELDAAMGNGAKLTEIVQRGQNPDRDVIFRTSWDEMRIEPEQGDTKALFAEIRSDEHAARIRDYGEASVEQRGKADRVLFGEILHGSPSPAPQPEKPSQVKVKGDGGMEM